MWLRPNSPGRRRPLATTTLRPAAISPQADTTCVRRFEAQQCPSLRPANCALRVCRIYTEVNRLAWTLVKSWRTGGAQSVRYSPYSSVDFVARVCAAVTNLVGFV